jgi:hypothetical protein
MRLMYIWDLVVCARLSISWVMEGVMLSGRPVGCCC